LHAIESNDAGKIRRLGLLQSLCLEQSCVKMTAMTIATPQLIGGHSILMITFDTLRYDVAMSAMASGNTPHLSNWLPNNEWELRHTPGNFTYAAHQAFFAGFLPTPAKPGKHPRLFAAKFPGSETTTEETFVFDAPDIVTGFASCGYHTVCIGGVGFFNRLSPLGCVLPNLFHEAHWSEELGVTCADSTQHQVACAIEAVSRRPTTEPLFLFLNLSALHQPNCHYTPGANEDSAQTQAAALAYVDSQLPPLVNTMRKRSPVLAIFTSDHGVAYGEDGFHGHRLGHPTVWDVPYGEVVLAKMDTE